MLDIVDNLTRSHMLAEIKKLDTKPELLISNLLHRTGFRFHLHMKELSNTISYHDCYLLVKKLRIPLEISANDKNSLVITF